mmetsp:Transcript_101558/g.293904  ORF Transcript_101558/g.293904 Transcript_101558/m.293904 type:complete len:206 (-) Transcript_101558:2058-2675(-)
MVGHPCGCELLAARAPRVPRERVPRRRQRHRHGGRQRLGGDPLVPRGSMGRRGCVGGAPGRVPEVHVCLLGSGLQRILPREMHLRDAGQPHGALLGAGAGYSAAGRQVPRGAGRWRGALHGCVLRPWRGPQHHELHLLPSERRLARAGVVVHRGQLEPGPRGPACLEPGSVAPPRLGHLPLAGNAQVHRQQDVLQADGGEHPPGA